MFDEILRPSKSRERRKQAWLWIGVCAAWLLYGAKDIGQHRAFGWPIVLVWAFAMLIWIRRLVAGYRDDA